MKLRGARFRTAGECEDAVIAPGERNRFGPGEGRTRGGLEARQIEKGREGGESAAGTDEAGRVSHGGLHLVDSAESDAIKWAGQSFSAAGINFGIDAGNADGFLEKGGFFALGFGKGDGDLGAAYRDGNTGEAGSGAVVEEGADARWEGMGAGNGFDKMAGEDGAGVADGGQVDAGIPANNKRKIVAKLFKLW